MAFQPDDITGTVERLGEWRRRRDIRRWSRLLGSGKMLSVSLNSDHKDGMNVDLGYISNKTLELGRKRCGPRTPCSQTNPLSVHSATLRFSGLSLSIIIGRHLHRTQTSATTCSPRFVLHMLRRFTRPYIALPAPLSTRSNPVFGCDIRLALQPNSSRSTRCPHI